MTIIVLFVNISTCGDIMVDKKEQLKLYLKVKKLYVNKKYSALEKEATKFLDNFSDDTNVRFMRAKAYRKLNRFDEAINDLKHILNSEFNEYAIIELYFVYYYLNMYNEALDMLPLVYQTNSINNFSVSISETVMKKQMGMEISLRKGTKCDYIRGQILNYSTEEAIFHINKHVGKTEKEKSYFNENVDIRYLFNKVRENIKNSIRVNTEEVMQIYYFGVANIGISDNQVCNFIKVVVVPNTNDIISMYPTNIVDYNYVANLDIEYDKLLKTDNKVKTMSRIDKFNKKYNIK